MFCQAPFRLGVELDPAEAVGDRLGESRPASFATRLDPAASIWQASQPSEPSAETATTGTTTSS